MSLPKNIEQTHKDELHKPNSSIRDFTEEEATFIRAQWELQYIKSTKDKTNEAIKRNN